MTLDVDRLIELAGLCEAASGPDRELDRLIELTLPGVAEHPHDRGAGPEPYVISTAGHPHYGSGQGYIPARYSASLDAAMTLVPEGMAWNGYFDRRGSRACVLSQDGFDQQHTIAASPALALCAASLRAMSVAEQKDASL